MQCRTIKNTRAIPRIQTRITKRIISYYTRSRRWQKKKKNNKRKYGQISVLQKFPSMYIYKLHWTADALKCRDFDDNYCTIFVNRYNTDDARIDGVTIIYNVEMKKKFAIRGSVKETNVLFYTRVHTYYYI